MDSTNAFGGTSLPDPNTREDEADIINSFFLPGGILDPEENEETQDRSMGAEHQSSGESSFFLPPARVTESWTTTPSTKPQALSQPSPPRLSPGILLNTSPSLPTYGSAESLFANLPSGGLSMSPRSDATQNAWLRGEAPSLQGDLAMESFQTDSRQHPVSYSDSVQASLVSSPLLASHKNHAVANSVLPAGLGGNVPDTTAAIGSQSRTGKYLNDRNTSSIQTRGQQEKQQRQKQSQKNTLSRTPTAPQPPPGFADFSTIAKKAAAQPNPQTSHSFKTVASPFSSKNSTVKMNGDAPTVRQTVGKREVGNNAGKDRKPKTSGARKNDSRSVGKVQIEAESSNTEDEWESPKKFSPMPVGAMAKKLTSAGVTSLEPVTDVKASISTVKPTISGKTNEEQSIQKNETPAEKFPAISLEKSQDTSLSTSSTTGGHTSKRKKQAPDSSKRPGRGPTHSKNRSRTQSSEDRLLAESLAGEEAEAEARKESNAENGSQANGSVPNVLEPLQGTMRWLDEIFLPAIKQTFLSVAAVVSWLAKAATVFATINLHLYGFALQDLQTYRWNELLGLMYFQIPILGQLLEAHLSLPHFTPHLLSYTVLFFLCHPRTLISPPSEETEPVYLFGSSSKSRSKDRPASDFTRRLCWRTLRLLQISLPFVCILEGFEREQTALMSLSQGGRVHVFFLLRVLRESLIFHPLAWFSLFLQYLLVWLCPSGLIWMELLGVQSAIALGMASIHIAREWRTSEDFKIQLKEWIADGTMLD